MQLKTIQEIKHTKNFILHEQLETKLFNESVQIQVQHINKNTGTDLIIWTERHIFVVVASTHTEINQNNDIIYMIKL
jgi:hypothetical protein